MPTESAVEQSEDQLETAGSRLREARRERNLSEKDVADSLHITVHYVKALETNRYEKLPGAIFAKGYIKSYANLLGLDSKELMALYERFQSRKQEAQQESAAQEARHSRDRNRPWALASVAIFITIFVALWAFNSFNSDSPSQAAAPARDNAQGSTTETGRVARGEPVALQPALITPAATVPEPEPVSPQAGQAALRLQSGAGNPDNTQGQSPETVTPVPALAADNTRRVPTPDRTTDNPVIPAQTEVANSLVAAQSDAIDAAFTAAQSEPRITIAEQADGARQIQVTSPGSDVLRISFAGASWVEVDDADARRIYQSLREAGDVLEITGNGPFNILLGDAPLVTLEINGDEVDVSDDIRIDNSARLTVGL